MRDITVKKDKVLEILRKNRAAHKGIFDEAVEGYKREALARLEQEIARIQRGSLAAVYVQVPTPVNHTNDYDRAIGMVEMHEGDDVQLSEDDYSQYVMDDWAWKHDFLSRNSGYSSTALAMLER